MTDRRRLAALALIPATAGVFGASVAWAGAHDPMAADAASAAATPVAAAATPDAAQVAQDQQMADLAAQVEAARVRIAELQVVLSTRAADAAALAAPLSLIHI